MFGNKTEVFEGSRAESQSEVNLRLLPVGLSRVTCDGYLSFAYVELESGQTTDFFCLDPGKNHYVRRPEGVLVIAEAQPEVTWSVKWPGRFNPHDPNRVEAGMIRPRSPKEEQMAFLQEVAARALGGRDAQLLRSGQAEIDPTQDDYSEEHDDDEQAPLSTAQLAMIIDELQSELKEQQRLESKQKDIEEEAPPVDLKNGGNAPPIPPVPPKA